VSSAELIEFQAILADCVTAQTAAENAATTAEAFAYQLTTTDLIASTATFAAATSIPTSGFATSGDGGNGSWKQNGVTGQTPSQSPAQLGDALLNDGNGNQWALASAYGARAGELGALIGNPDSASSLSAALNGVGSSTIIDGITTITSGVAVSSASLYMQGTAKSKINKTTDGNALTVSASHNATTKDFDVGFTGKDVNISGHGLTIKDSDNATIEKIKFTGVDGLGFGCFIYSDISVTNYGCSIKDTYHEGTTTNYSVANGGAMLVDAEFGLISNTRTKGITRFPVELKGNSTYCIIENSFIDDSVWGLYYGTQTADHPSYSIANNLIVKGADTSLYSGYGTNNIYHNILINNLSADGSRIGNGNSIGVKLINTENSIATNILTDNDGADLDVPLEVSGTSKNNHISIAPRHSNAEVLAIGANTEKNSIEVLGMRNGTSIFATNVVNYQAPNHSGGAGNSIYNHATGERWGSFSGRFRDRLEDAAAVTLFSTDTFVQDVPTDQQGRHVLTCADSQKAGYAVVTPTYRGEMQFRPDIGGGWQLSGGGGMSYRWDSSSFKTTSDNAASLGNASTRWSKLYVMDGVSVGGIDVIGTQQPSVADATDAASAITQLNSLLAKLRVHGLIDT
jgi:hypothetical protein